MGLFASGSPYSFQVIPHTSLCSRTELSRATFSRDFYSGGKGKLIRRGGSGKRNGYLSLKFSFAKELTSIVSSFFPS
jgi:hypothetical protein